MKIRLYGNGTSFRYNSQVPIVILFVSLLCFYSNVNAQAPLNNEPENTQETSSEEAGVAGNVAPPALKNLSENEKKTLAAESSVKKRTQISFQMMDSRLAAAEQSFAADNFKQSLADLAGFEALMDDSFNFLVKNDVNNKADSRFKSLEIYLRKQMPRLEIMRRSMPYAYSYHVLKLMKAVREIRGKAVEPLFEESVASNQ